MKDRICHGDGSTLHCVQVNTSTQGRVAGKASTESMLARLGMDNSVTPGSNAGSRTTASPQPTVREVNCSPLFFNLRISIHYRLSGGASHTEAYRLSKK